MTVTRPPRTPAHAERDALLLQFAARGLQPVISVNGSIPEADIQVTKALLDEGGKYGEVLDARLTLAGAKRLIAAGYKIPDTGPVPIDEQFSVPMTWPRD